MAKITLTNLVNLENQTTAVNAINNNNNAIEAAVENTLSRDGTTPNQMESLLDMNDNAIINLPEPSSLYEPLRLIDVTTLNGGGSIPVTFPPQPAYTLTANNSAITAVPADMSIAALTTKASPAAGDYLLLSDQAASGAFKKVLVSALASTGAVTSIAGNTGAFTLSNGITNSTNDIRLDTSFFQNYLTGLGMANNGADATNDIDISAGCACDSTNVAIMKLTSAITKQLDAAWAVGTNAGGRMSAAAIANTTYHVWLIQRSDTGVVDVGFDVSPTTPTMPTNYDRKRRIGSIIRSGGTILAFVQDGNDFVLSSPAVDVNAVANPGTAAVTRTLTVPTGIRVKANLSVGALYALDGTNQGIAVLLSDLAIPDIAAATNNCQVAITSQSGNNMLAKSTAQIYTSTSATIRSRVSVSNANFFLTITTYGWTDTRGQ